MLPIAYLFNWCKYCLIRYNYHMAISEMHINQNPMAVVRNQRETLAALCSRLGATRLSLVGSAVRPDFAPQSDVDVLVELVGTHGRFDRYFELKEALEALFGREVDLIETDALKNPHVKQTMSEDEVTIYEA